MNEELFCKALRRVFAAFGKRAPSDAVADAVYRRVRDFPDGFIDFFESRLIDRESLPANLGLFLLRELWPEYARGLPEQGRKKPGCGNPECEGGMRRVYFLNTRETYALAPCVCNDDPRHARSWWRRATEAELNRRGLSFYPRELTPGEKAKVAAFKERVARLRQAQGEGAPDTATAAAVWESF